MKQLYFIIIFCIIIIEIYSDEKIISNSLYPVTLTLYNENILLITQDEIIFYDPTLTNVLKNYTLNESVRVSNVSESYKTNVVQYSNEYDNYILAIIKDNLFLFNKAGEKLQEKDLSEKLSEYKLYYLTPIKKLGQDLYFIISLTNQALNEIFLFYYQINILTGEYTLKQLQKYHPKTILGQNCTTISENIECQMMNSNENKNIFSCFYMAFGTLSISVTSFDYENDLKELPLYSNKTVAEGYNCGLVRAKSAGNKSTALITLTYSGSSGYICYYDINTNIISSPFKYTGPPGSSFNCFKLEYFEQSEQFVLSNKADNKNSYEIVLINKDYLNKNLEKEIDKKNFELPDGSIHRDSIIYLKNEKCYAIISDIKRNSLDLGIKLFETNLEAELINEFTESEKEEEENYKKECPEEAPYLINESKQCSKNCSSYNFFKYYCKIDNKNPKFKDEMFKTIEKDIMNNSLNFLLSNIDNYELFVNEDNTTFEITTSENEKKNYNNNNITSIILGECETVLRTQYEIENNMSLIILKSGISLQNLLMPLIKYKVFNPKTKQSLNLSYCEKMFINISIPVSINEEDIFKHDPSSDYYNNKCFSYTTENKTDIILDDRRNEYINNNMFLCEEDCKYGNYNSTTKKVTCECKVREKERLFENIQIDKNKLINNFKNISSFLNLDIMKCYDILFCKNGIIYNIGSYIFLFIILFYIISIFIFYKKDYNKLHHQIKDIISKRKLKRKNNDGNKLTKNSIKILKKNKTIKSDKNEYKESLSNSVNISQKSIHSNLRIHSPSKFKNKKKICNTKIYKKKTIHKKINDFNDYELNNLNYEEALIYDKRTYIEFYFSALKTNHSLIFTFFNNNDYNSKIIKICLFLFTFGLYLTVNTLFFSDSTMHKIYEDQGIFNLNYQIPKICLSTTISVFISFIIKLLSLTQKNILEIKRLKSVKIMINRFPKVLNHIKLKFILFYVLSLIFLIFFWYYLSCFCVVYKNTQTYLIKNTSISFCISLLYPFFLLLIPGTLRIPSLHNKEKKYKYMFEISKAVLILI